MPRQKPPGTRQPRTAKKIKKTARPKKSTRHSQGVGPTTRGSDRFAEATVPSGLIPITLQDRTSLGFLLMDVSALQAVLVSNLKAAGFPTALAPALASWASGVMLPGLAHQVERFLNIEVAAAPFELPGLGSAQSHNSPRIISVDSCHF